jgi:DNA-binding MarR family transcriptional regulator
MPAEGGAPMAVWLAAADEHARGGFLDHCRRMGIDRTTMVALIDDLQERGLVQRRQDPDDRRRNVVELTDAGQDITRQAARAGEQAERAFLNPLSASEAQQFKKTLRALLYNPPVGPR